MKFLWLKNYLFPGSAWEETVLEALPPRLWRDIAANALKVRLYFNCFAAEPL